MLIEPRIRGFICTTAHPTGCAARVDGDIAIARAAGPIPGPRRVLVVGSSMGYGLASRIAATFGCGADTAGVFFERPSEGKRTATAGWYNTAAFGRRAREAGRIALDVNGDAFSDEIKAETIERIAGGLGGPLDLVVYSLAAPRRTDPATGVRHASVLKPIGAPFESKTIDVMKGEISTIRLEAATERETSDTIAVMGGADWALWIDALDQAGLLADGARTIAYSYIGPALTHAIYRQGTIGRAKDDLERTARTLTERLAGRGGRALVAVNKAVVTQSSSAIPVVPLYISILFKVMADRGLHEGTIEQMVRLFADRLAADEIAVDEAGRIRLDDREMAPEVQDEVARIWERVSTDDLAEVADLDGYRRDFHQLFGFAVPGVDYAAEVDPVVDLEP